MHPTGSNAEYVAWLRYAGECEEDGMDTLPIGLWRFHGCPKEPLYSVNRFPAWAVED